MGKKVVEMMMLLCGVIDGDDGSTGGTDTDNENGNGGDVGNSNENSNKNSNGGSNDDNTNPDDELPEDGIFVIPESTIGVVSIGLASIASLVVYLMMRGRIEHNLYTYFY